MVHAIRLSLACMLALIPGAWPALAMETQPEEKSERCVYPDPYALMGGEFGGLERVDYFFSFADRSRLRWLFISWEGPPDGEVFVLDCDGHIRAKREFGYVEQTNSGPDPGGRNSVEVRYVPDSGTGIDDHSVAILSFDGKAINVLWDHAVDDRATQPAYTFGGKPQSNGMRTDEQIYEWEYDTHGLVIKVTGRETRSTDTRTIRRKLPSEKYCFKAAEMKYVRCK